MQPSIIAILIFLIFFAVLSYYLGFIRPPFVLDFIPKSIFIFSVFLIIPFLTFALWTQTSEKNRLQETGVVPHPSIEHAVGMTISLTEHPTWIFSVDPSLQTATDFYLDEDNRPGWDILSDDPEMLLLKRGEETMSISVSNTRGDASIIYMLSPKEN